MPPYNIDDNYYLTHCFYLFLLHILKTNNESTVAILVNYFNGNDELPTKK